MRIEQALADYNLEVRNSIPGSGARIFSNSSFCYFHQTEEKIQPGREAYS
jgi:hypothetical protein